MLSMSRMITRFLSVNNTNFNVTLFQKTNVDKHKFYFAIFKILRTFVA